MQVWNVLHTARWRCRTQKSPTIRYLGTIAQICRAISSHLRHVSTIGKLLNSNVFSACPYNMANIGPLTAEIGSGVWGTPANFNGFRVLASLLQRRRSPKANQTLHDVWPSLGLVHYVFIFGASCPLTEFCHVQNSLCIQVLHSPILAVLLHGTPAAGVSQLCGAVQGMNLRNFRRGRHLYSAGWPSRWASASSVSVWWLSLSVTHFVCRSTTCYSNSHHRIQPTGLLSQIRCFLIFCANRFYPVRSFLI